MVQITGRNSAIVLFCTEKGKAKAKNGVHYMSAGKPIATVVAIP